MEHLDTQIDNQWKQICSYLSQDIRKKNKGSIDEITLLLQGLSEKSALREITVAILRSAEEAIQKTGKINNDNENVINRGLYLLNFKLWVISVELDYFERASKPESIIKKTLKKLTGATDKKIVPLVEKVNAVVEEANEKLNQANEIEETLKSKAETINNLESEIQNIGKQIREKKQESESIAETVINNLKEAEGKIQKNSEKYTQDISNFSDEIKDLLNKSEEISKRNQDQSKEIANILAGANQAGMASSFQKNAENVRWPMWGFLLLLVISSLSIVGFGIVVGFDIIEQSGTWHDVLSKRLFIIPPVVFLTWFFAHRYNQLAQLKEKYIFKYTTAMAFQGYKKQIEDLTSDEKYLEEKQKLLNELLRISIDIFSDDPTKIREDKEFLLNKKDLSSLLKKILEKQFHFKNDEN